MWVHLDRLSPGALDQLNASDCGLTETCVTLGAFEDAFADLATYVANHVTNGGQILVTKPSVYLPGASYAVYEAVSAEVAWFGDSPILRTKTVKNEVR